MWIRKNETPEWNFPGTEDLKQGAASYDLISGSQLLQALTRLAESDTQHLPFQIYDCREGHERDIADLAESLTIETSAGEKKTIGLPRVQLDLYELQTGYFLEGNFRRNQWILIMCQLGLKSGQAHRYLLSKGYNSKVLLGGLDALPRKLQKY